VSEANDWSQFSLLGVKVVYRGLRDTIRMAKGPGEVVGVIQAFAKAATWTPAGRSPEERDHVLRLDGVTHVLGLRTGEMFTPVEIYRDAVYDKLPSFVTQPGWTVIDVGANAGVFSVQQALRGAHVYCFEPNPDCFRRLRKAVAANGVDHLVTASNAALGSKPGTARLSVPQGLTTMGSLRPEWAGGEGEDHVTVELETIDRAMRRFGIGHVDLLKIDVEGLEIDVLGGAAASLAHVDRVVIEYHSMELGRQVHDILSAHGLVPVMDEPLYRGDENRFKGVGRGVLFASRQPGTGAVARPS
jgi:FkbM family methyltransferase